MTDETDDRDQAAAWALRLEGEAPVDPATQAELDAWLAGDARRAGALLRAEATLAYVGRARILAVQTVDEAANRGRRDFVRWAAAAAVIVTAAGVAASLWRPSQREQFATTVGEVRRIPLADGSMASLNTASELTFSADTQERRARLTRGEVWFQVAHERARPFVVESGTSRIRAVGTAFSVRRRDGGTEVMVTEGVVETWIDGGTVAPVRVAAGHSAFLRSDTPAATAIALDTTGGGDGIDRALAWRGGDLALDGETLAEAAAEINRYNVRQISVDPRVAGERMVGYFRTSDPTAFARAAAATVGGRTIVTPDGIMITVSAR